MPPAALERELLAGNGLRAPSWGRAHPYVTEHAPGPGPCRCCWRKVPLLVPGHLPTTEPMPTPPLAPLAWLSCHSTQGCCLACWEMLGYSLAFHFLAIASG